MSSQSVIIGDYCKEFGWDDIFFACDYCVYFNQISSSSSLRQSCKIQYCQSVTITPVLQICTHFVALCRTFSRTSTSFTNAGLHAWTQYSRCGLLCFVKYSEAVFVYLCKVSFDHPEDWLCFVGCLDTLGTRFEVRRDKNSQIFLLGNFLQLFVNPVILYDVLYLWPMCITLHLSGLNFNCQFSDHASGLCRSVSSRVLSLSSLILCQTFVSSANIFILFCIQLGRSLT